MKTPRERYDDLVRETCDAVARGAPPWGSEAAHLGACLWTTGAPMRGLTAVLAWQASSREPNPVLLWGAESASDAPETSVILPTPGRHGVALVAARPSQRPVRANGPRMPWPVEDLDRRLSNLQLESLTVGRATRGDEVLILAIAEALLRPLGQSGAGAFLGATGLGPCPPERLARAAGWAQWLVDELGLGTVATKSRFPVPGGRVSRRVPRAHAVVDTMVERLRSDPVLLDALPPELREPGVGVLAPLRAELFATRPLRRAPPTGALRARVAVFGRRRAANVATIVLRAAGWREEAALGLALCSALQRPALSPSEAWRTVGHHLRLCLTRGERIDLHLPADRSPAVRTVWDSLLRHHRASTWCHPWSSLRLHELVATGRWDEAALAAWVASWGGVWPRDAGRRVAELPIVSIASLRRPRHRRDTQEEAVLAELGQALGCSPTWPAVTAAFTAGAWTREGRPKRSGGLRWLDVPSPTLAAASRVVGDLLHVAAPVSRCVTAFHAGASPALHASAHAGAAAAACVDLSDFFGRVRPGHLRPWLHEPSFLPGWSEEGREGLEQLVFLCRGSGSYLPQGAPASPAAANLAGRHLDNAVVHAAVEAFGAGAFTYTRYADDLVLSLRAPTPSGAERARDLLLAVCDAQRWRVSDAKTHCWTATQGSSLLVCGLRVPGSRDGHLSLDKATYRRARAAMHALQHRIGWEHGEELNKAHGLMAYAYAATGDPRWLAYTSRHVSQFARKLAGPLFAESVLAGWSEEQGAPLPLPEPDDREDRRLELGDSP